MNHQGQARELNAAFAQAWEKLKQDVGRPDPNRWYPAQIEVQGSNPINQFRVTLES